METIREYEVKFSDFQEPQVCTELFYTGLRRNEQNDATVRLNGVSVRPFCLNTRQQEELPVRGNCNKSPLTAVWPLDLQQ
jgi:hypothetical protein